MTYYLVYLTIRHYFTHLLLCGLVGPAFGLLAFPPNVSIELRNCCGFFALQLFPGKSFPSFCYCWYAVCVKNSRLLWYHIEDSLLQTPSSLRIDSWIIFSIHDNLIILRYTHIRETSVLLSFASIINIYAPYWNQSRVPPYNASTILLYDRYLWNNSC